MMEGEDLRTKKSCGFRVCVWVISANKIAEPPSFVRKMYSKDCNIAAILLLSLSDVNTYLHHSNLFTLLDSFNYPWIKNAMRFPVPFFQFR